MSFFGRGNSSSGPAAPLLPSVPATPMKPGGGPSAPVGGTGPRTSFRVDKSPSEALAMTNCIIGSPKDFDANTKYILIDDLYAFTLRLEPSFPSGQLGTSLFHRRFAFLSLNQEVRARPYDVSAELPNPYLGSLHMQVSFLKKGFETPETYDTAEMAQVFLQSFDGHILGKDQTLCFDFHGVNLVVAVTSMQALDISNFKGSLNSKGGDESPMKSVQRGVLMQQTQIQFTKAADSTIKLKGSAKGGPTTAIIQPDFKFEDLGIGGLDKEFSAIFRRAFASRIFPAALVEKLGIQHVKGILLFGPPGTGKTLMARQIGKMLNAREPIIVNGPEILNKYVGQSEENIRKLFAPAETEYKAKGEESSLHIIIFDELDAICRQRGSVQSGTGVGDSIVNQLLAKMDGVEQLNNILIIGMTNRLDMIDEALLRPGRLEIHMEISLPDEKGRFEILKIHTSKMRENDILDPDVDLEELSAISKNYSGAEIAGVCKSASSFAFNRHIKVGSLASVAPDVDKMKVKMDDFLHALDEVKPAFGVSESELSLCVQNGIIRYSPVVDHILDDGQRYVSSVRNSPITPLISILLHGPPNSGKTAMAASMAMQSDFPFVKLISPESMVGYSETSKMSQIKKVFDDAYKSPLSVIVIDGIERLLDWVPLGPRFSNVVLQTLLVLMKKVPPKGRRLLIIATTSRRTILDSLDMSDFFDAEIFTPTINSISAVEAVLKEVKVFTDDELVQVVQQLRAANLEGKLNIGVKKLLMVAEMAKQDDVGTIDKFLTELVKEGVNS